MPKRGEHVLDRVVLVHREIAAGDELEVERRVEGEQRQQVVEEADPGLDPRAAAPVEVERQSQRGLGRRPEHRRVAAGRRPRLGPERAQQHVVLRGAADRDADALGERPHDDPLGLEPAGRAVPRCAGTRSSSPSAGSRGRPRAVRSARARVPQRSSRRRRGEAPGARRRRSRRPARPREPEHDARRAAQRCPDGRVRSRRGARRSRMPSTGCAARRGSAASPPTARTTFRRTRHRPRRRPRSSPARGARARRSPRATSSPRSGCWGCRPSGRWRRRLPRPPRRR